MLTETGEKVNVCRLDQENLGDASFAMYGLGLKVIPSKLRLL